MQYAYDKVWDASKIMGCVCDIAHTGFDCSLRKCPSGDDPLTTGQVNEKQLIRCLASTGSLVLYYR
jgi:hypothetical protein